MLKTIHTHRHSDSLCYSGEQLSPHWIYNTFGVLGPGAVSFTGPADVALTHMVDLEDVQAASPIVSANMLHFIVELFGVDFTAGVAFQRLIMARLAQRLNTLCGRSADTRIHCDGDDLMVGQRKLSVSICTVSLTSVLMHIGLNIDPTGAPVAALGLETDLGLDTEAVETLAQETLKGIATEWEDIQRATWKVTPR